MGTSRGWRLAALGALGGLLVAGYALQLFSPLRLNTDAYRLLGIAESAFHDKGYLLDGHRDPYPLGYPFLVNLLLHAGVAHSATFILLNLLSLAAALCCLGVAGRAMAGQAFARLSLLFALFSWVTVKHVTLAHTDFVYMALSAAALLCLARYDAESGRRKWPWILSALALALAALQVRTVAVTLFPVIAICLVAHAEIGPRLRSFPRRPAAVAAVVLLAGLLGWLGLWLLLKCKWYETQFLGNNSYFQALLKHFGNSFLSRLLIDNVPQRLLELGEILMNLPAGKLPGARHVCMAAGAAAWAAAGCGTWRTLRSGSHLPLPLYFASYSVLMLLWPSYDPRFWLPLLPVLAMLLLQGVRPLLPRQAVRAAVGVYAAGFVALGFAALGFSARLSLSGRDFGEHYGNDQVQMTYRYALDNGKPVDMRKVSARMVRVLKTYEPLAKDAVVPEQGAGDEP